MSWRIHYRGKETGGQARIGAGYELRVEGSGMQAGLPLSRETGSPVSYLQ